jgi:hypothetical protein
MLAFDTTPNKIVEKTSLIKKGMVSLPSLSKEQTAAI